MNLAVMKYFSERQRRRLRLPVEIHDRRVRGAREAVVAHPDDETAAARETVFARPRRDRRSASAWRAWLHATNSSRLAGSRPCSWTKVGHSIHQLVRRQSGLSAVPGISARSPLERRMISAELAPGAPVSERKSASSPAQYSTHSAIVPGSFHGP